MALGGRIGYYQRMFGLPDSVISISTITRTVVVCAWCETKREGDEWAREHDCKVSHGMCPKCKEGFEAEVRSQVTPPKE